MSHVWLDREQVQLGRAELSQRAQDTLSLLRRTCVAGSNLDHRYAVQVLRDHWKRGRAPQVEHGPQLVWSRGDEVAVKAHYLGSFFGAIDNGAREDHRIQWMKSVLKRRHHSEVASPTSQAPKEVGVLVL